MEKFYSDRVTEIFMAPGPEDSIIVYEVTLEDTRRKSESVDFETFAWCPDQDSANRIANALNAKETEHETDSR